MLKKNFSIIIALVIFILSLTIPIVMAENETTEEPDSQKSDVYLSGDDITVDYNIDGNLFVVANSVTINSKICGDVFIFAKSTTLGDQSFISGNLFTYSDNIDIKGTMYDLYAISKNVNISGTIYRDIKVSTDTLNISGVVERNAFVKCSNISFANQTSTSENDTSSEEQQDSSFVTTNGKISGNLNYISKSELNIPEGFVGSNVTYKPDNSSNNQFANKITSLCCFIFIVVIVWLLCSWIAPKFINNSHTYLTKKTFSVIFSGLLTPCILIFISMVLIMSKLTVIVSLILFALLFILLGISVSCFVIAINSFVCTKLKINNKFLKFGLLIGYSCLLWLLSLIPYVDSMVTFISTIIGIGLVVYPIITKNKIIYSENQQEEN